MVCIKNTHARAYTHTHIRTHARTHIHTHTIPLKRTHNKGDNSKGHATDSTNQGKENGVQREGRESCLAGCRSPFSLIYLLAAARVELRGLDLST